MSYAQCHLDFMQRLINQQRSHAEIASLFNQQFPTMRRISHNAIAGLLFRKALKRFGAALKLGEILSPPLPRPPQHPRKRRGPSMPQDHIDFLQARIDDNKSYKE